MDNENNGTGTMLNGNNGAEATIDRQAKDILGITAQNEVIQSFVRSELGLNSDKNAVCKNRSTSKESKVASINWKATTAPIHGNTNLEKKESKEELDMKNAQFYQQLGKDAQTIHVETNKKSRKKWDPRRERLIEEVYTDKDRAAAVNLGSRDIKQSLKLKRRQDRTRILEISEEAHPGTLLTLAIHRFKNGDIYGAVKFVNKALELNPFDKYALVARSKCHLFMGNAEAALNDAENALREDKSFIKGLYQKGEALYHLAQFEFSLLYFHKGLHIRSHMEDFRQGVFKAQQAILNTIGRRVPSFEKIILSKNQCHLKENPIIENPLNRKVVDKVEVKGDPDLLKELQTDKIYLEKLIQNPGITNVNDRKKVEDKILSEAKDGMKFLENRQHFWQQQKSLLTKKSEHSFGRQCALKSNQ